MPRSRGEADSHRLLGLELPALAQRRLLPAAPAASPLARLLRAPLRHRRGQLDLLPSTPRERRGELGERDASRLPLRREDEPLRDAHQAAARPVASIELFYSTSARWSSRQPGPRGSPAWPARRRAARGALEQPLRAAIASVPPRDPVAEPVYDPLAPARRRTRTARHARAAVPDARANGRLDTVRFHYGCRGRQTPERELRVGARLAYAEDTRSSRTSTTTERVRSRNARAPEVTE